MPRRKPYRRSLSCTNHGVGNLLRACRVRAEPHIQPLPIVLRAALLVLATVSTSHSQDRDTKVRADREKITQLGGWIYNDLAEAERSAASQNKPLAIVFRCIPCEACQQFDDEVARRDPRIADLLDQFVCVRIVQANTLDLTRFQHDFDQSFAMTLMNADGTIYARFGTRSNRDDESQDISLDGLRETLTEALRVHDTIESTRPLLAGKRVSKARFATPLDYPSLKGKYQSALSDAEGQIARSCVHCHQIGEAERLVFRSRGEPIPDDVLYPYPNPRVVGLDMDPKRMSTVRSVADGSAAQRSGFIDGDKIDTLSGQSILSTADLQWALHHAPDSATLRAVVTRNDRPITIDLVLPAGWRRQEDLSWRATTWDLRRMAQGGMQLVPATDEERRSAGVASGKMALTAKHVGEYGDHAVAKLAGLQPGDVIVGFDGRNDFNSETALIAYGVQKKKPGDDVDVRFVRDGKDRSARIRLQ